jgi:hypothetical protein
MSAPPPPVPGIIDGSMTVHTEAGGGVSIRVVIMTGADPAGQCGLIELVIGADNARGFARAVAASGPAAGSVTSTGVTSTGVTSTGPEQPFPCHIGFGQHAPAPRRPEADQPGSRIGVSRAIRGDTRHG